MTLRECYEAMGGGYEGVASRLPSEKMIQKFVLKFLNDGSYDLLCSSLAEQNYEDAFRAAHTIKGVCQNLNFVKLMDSSSKLTEALRGGWSDEAADLVEAVHADYKLTVSAIRAFQEGLV